MLLLLFILNLMFDLSGMVMFFFVEKVKIMLRQVGERETVNTGSLLSWRVWRRLADLFFKCVDKGFWI